MNILPVNINSLEHPGRMFSAPFFVVDPEAGDASPRRSFETEPTNSTGESECASFVLLEMLANINSENQQC